MIALKPVSEAEVDNLFGEVERGANNLALGGDDKDEGGGGEPPGSNCTGASNYERQVREFQLANARNIYIVPSSGGNMQINKYLPSNNALRRLMLVQGKDGDELLDILDEVEQCGGEKFT